MALKDLSIVIKGAGEMASGVAWRLYRSGFRRIVMLETAQPLAVRRRVCFCEAVYDGAKQVDGVPAVLVENDTEIDAVMARGALPVVIDPSWRTIGSRRPRVVIDAIIAKKNLGTTMTEAELVIGLGPGFEAGTDVHVVIETNRGPDCGRLLYSGSAQKNTGIPGKVMGVDVDRVIRAPADGVFIAHKQLDESVKNGEIIGEVAGTPVRVALTGVLRGLIRDRIPVTKGLKIGDIEPREHVDNYRVSDKSLGLGGAVLEAVMTKYNT